MRITLSNSLDFLSKSDHFFGKTRGPFAPTGVAGLEIQSLKISSCFQYKILTNRLEHAFSHCTKILSYSQRSVG